MTLIREVCHHPGCTELQVASDYNYRGTGQPFYRKWCWGHHLEMKAKKAGLSVTAYRTRTIRNMAEKAGITVAEYYAKKAEKVAKNAGYDSVTEYKNSKHPYRKHRKDHCENRDGRLGYKCNYKIRHTAQLQVDHVDGNPRNNKVKNLQTLCANCHTYKTHVHRDYATPGRKILRAA